MGNSVQVIDSEEIVKALVNLSKWRIVIAETDNFKDVHYCMHDVNLAARCTHCEIVQRILRKAIEEPLSVLGNI